LAAQQAQDAQARRERMIELRGQGFSEPEARATANREQAGREQERAARAAAFRTTETRRASELELANTARGIGGGDARGARLQLRAMQDVDAFREQLARNMEELGPGHAAEASQLALRTTAAGIRAQTFIKPGEGQVADSLAQLGLGGGVYAGVGGDPQLQAQKRIGDLQTEANRILEEISKKVNLGVK
jgi:hypothetical protein